MFRIKLKANPAQQVKLQSSTVEIYKTITGDSAYETWLKQGNKGTEEDFIACLKGESGATGPQGEAGPQGPKGVSGVHFGADTPPDDANVWINPDGAPTGTEEWEFDLDNGTTDRKTVVVLDAQQANGQLAILKVRQEDGTWAEIPAVAGRKGDKGDKGDKGKPFLYEDFTAEQLEALKVKGDKGAKGDKGDKGDNGAKGDKGDTGSQGIQGIQGIQGEKGDTGDKGDNGVSATHHWEGTVLTITSASGTSSADLKGDKGQTGAKGEKGDKGDKGETGESGVTTPLNGFFTLSVDENGNLYAYSAEDGTTPDFEYDAQTGNLYIVQGNVQTLIGNVKGQRGVQGIQGIQGPAGPQGETGPQGPQGEQGPAGEKGEKGDTGPAGPQGEKGEKGDTGSQGIQGETGLQGPQGEQGPKGDKGDTGEVDYSRLNSYLPLTGGKMTGVIDVTDTTSVLQFGTTGYFRGKTASGNTFEFLGLINSTTLQVGGSYPALALKGKNDRPTYNGNDMALFGDIPSTTENWTFTLEDGSTVTKKVYIG